MLRIKSIQHRLAIFVLLPVALLLVAMGVAGFIYARDSLLNQWREATTLKLQRAAHLVDMRLSRPKELLKMFHWVGNTLYADQVRELVIKQLQGMPGVVRVALTWKIRPQAGGQTAPGGAHRMMRGRMGPMTGRNPAQKKTVGANNGHMMDMDIMPYRMADIVEFTLPHYDAAQKGETLSLLSNIKNTSGKIIGQLKIVLRFDYLMKAVESTGWWRHHKALLVDNIGRVLAGNLAKKRGRLAGNGDPLEQRTMYAIMAMPYGTIFGRGFPPPRISSFYKLQEAPWTLVIIAPGREVLAPILHFRLHYYATGAAFILLILLIIRQATRGTVRSIREVSRAAEKVAAGHYGIALPVKSSDEVGELIRSFNRMVVQLEERVRMKMSLNLAMDLQRSLLPHDELHIASLDIAGKCLYCDETGGDYYDFFQFPELGPHKIGVAVGDVSGHGVAAALLMTTARALIRSSIIHTDDLSQAVAAANRLLCLDTVYQGDFMTLFLMSIDTQNGEVRWVRAGHDPAMLYHPAEDDFIVLDGKGIALGVDENHHFIENRYSGWKAGDILLISTDGLWETENLHGERFGKERLRRVLQAHHGASAGEIISAVTAAADRFRGNDALEDDLTLVVIKQADRLA